jgi:hypothetical protein
MVLSEESVGAFCVVLTTKVTSPSPPQNPWVGAFSAIAFLAPNGSLCLMWKRQLVQTRRVLLSQTRTREKYLHPLKNPYP